MMPIGDAAPAPRRRSGRPVGPLALILNLPYFLVRYYRLSLSLVGKRKLISMTNEVLVAPTSNSTNKEALPSAEIQIIILIRRSFQEFWINSSANTASCFAGRHV